MIEKINQFEAIQRIGNQREAQQDDDRSLTNQNISLPKDKITLSYQAEGKQQNGSGAKDEELPPEQQREVTELKRRDAEVKAHELAHMAAGGGLVKGGASYQYQRGPDGRTYAVGGEVSIDASAERTPEATIRKMQQVKAAALAPAQPSGTDRAVAARATQTEAQARAEKNAQSEIKENEDTITAPESPAATQPTQQPVASQLQDPESGNDVSRALDDTPFAYQAFRSGSRESKTPHQDAIGKNISISI